MAFNNIRLYITESCNAKCTNCFNRNNRSNHNMDIEHYERTCRYLARNGTKQVKIMGGEPTIHPQFGELMKIAQKNFESVSLFTNAISKNLFLFNPRETDTITYNFKFSKILDRDRLMLDFQGIRNLEIQITSSVIKEELLNEIIRVVEICPDRIQPCFTLDCTADIYEDKAIIVPIYEYVWDECVKNGYNMKQDHLIPVCFLNGTKIRMPRTGSHCTLYCAGLIDSNFNLRFCNQYSDILLKIFDDKDHIVNPDFFSMHCCQNSKKYQTLSKKRDVKIVQCMTSYVMGLVLQARTQ